MNKRELISALAEATGSTKVTAEKHLMALVDITVENLRHGYPVKLPEIGTLDTRVAAARTVKLPGLPEKHLPERRAPKFKASATLKRSLAQ